MSRGLLIASLLGAACAGTASRGPAETASDASADPPERLDARPPADRSPVEAGVEPPPVLEACPPAAPPRLAGAIGVPVAIEIRAAGQPLRLGQEVVRADGVREKFTLLHAFLAQPSLIDGRGRRVAAQWADRQGTPLPYGLLLFGAELPSEVALLAPPGRYVALEVAVGVPAACNGGDPTKRVAPLNADSDMYWSWGSQYLFVRLEGFLNGKEGLQLHMGLDPLYRFARLPGDVTVAAGGAGKTIVFDVDGLIRPDGPGAEPISHVVTPSWVADHIAAGAVLSFE